MKKFLFTFLMVFVTSEIFAVWTSPFRTWDELIVSSPDIVVIKCRPPGPMTGYGNIVGFDIEVQAVLKGNRKPEMTRMETWSRAYPGQIYLLFGEYKEGVYQAHEEYRVIPLGEIFDTNDLKGKPFDEQIHLMLQRRLDNLKSEIQSCLEEKKRLEDRLKK